MCDMFDIRCEFKTNLYTIMYTLLLRNPSLLISIDTNIDNKNFR